MITPASSPQYFGGNTASTGTTQKKSLDKDAFLTLLVAQLKHQDPTSPLQPHELAAQLAQFSSVEQLTNLNNAMTTQTEATQMSMLVGQSALSASLIGREVEAVGDQVVIPSTGAGSVHVTVGGAGGSATLTLKDDGGNTVATRNLGSVRAGDQTLALPGDLPPGRWHYSLEVTGADKTPVGVTSYSSGTVTAVEFKNGAIVLHAGGIEIALTDLVRIEPAATAANTTTPTTTQGPAVKDGEPDPLGGPNPVETVLHALRGLVTL